MNKNTKNTVEVNGRVYDAHTGELLRDKNARSKTQKREAVGANDIHHKTQGTKTLRRELVAKPASLAQSAQKTHLIDHRPRPGVDIRLSHAVHPARALRANSTSRSALVGKFEAHAPTALKKSHAQLAVVPAPATPKPLYHTAIAIHAPQTGKHSLRHRAAARFRISRHLVAAGSTTVIALLLISLFLYNRTPHIMFSLASRGSGVAGSLPKETLPGYKLDSPISYSKGQITLNFKSDNPNLNYNLEERTTDWDSQALQANFAELKNNSYQSLLHRGRTIYVYAEHNATWVDGGVQYVVKGNPALTSDQILKIAASL